MEIVSPLIGLVFTKDESRGGHEDSDVAAGCEHDARHVGADHRAEIHGALDTVYRELDLPTIWSEYLSDDESRELGVGVLAPGVGDVAGVGEEHLEEDEELSAHGDADGGEDVELARQLVRGVQRRQQRVGQVGGGHAQAGHQQRHAPPELVREGTWTNQGRGLSSRDLLSTNHSSPVRTQSRMGPMFSILSTVEISSAPSW